MPGLTQTNLLVHCCERIHGADELVHYGHVRCIHPVPHESVHQGRVVVPEFCVEQAHTQTTQENEQIHYQ